MTTSIEDYITDVSQHGYQICGKLFSGDFAQVVKNNHDGNDLSLAHSFYSIDDDGAVKKLGGISFSENTEGSVSMNFNIIDDETGESSNVLELSQEGVAISGGFDVSGASTNFETTSIQVADFDINLGSNALTPSDLNGAGFIIGSDVSGTKSLLYSTSLDAWSTAAGFNVQTGHTFTVDTDSVIVGENGVIVQDTLLSKDGLQIGADVALTQDSLVIGNDIPVTLNANGLVVGNSLSLTTTAGLQAGDVTLNKDDGLIVGGVVSLDESGLKVGDSVSLKTDSGLTLGNNNFSAVGLTLSSTNSNSNTNFNFNSNSDGEQLILTTHGLEISNSISLTESNGLFFLNDQKINFSDEVTLDREGIHFETPGTAIYMSTPSQTSSYPSWKISIDPSTENLKFEHFQESSMEYVIKMELKSG